LNEMPYDVPSELKDAIMQTVQQAALHRYPEPFANSLVVQLAAQYGCQPEQVMVGPGSSSFIRLLLTYFGMNMKGSLVITRPSFAYYEQFCRSFGVAYETWELDENFEYDLSGLDNLPDYSVVCLTTPNNPTGNTLPATDVEALLRQNPRSLFIVDEAYVEFAEQSLLPLLDHYDNLLLLRTLSKAFGVANVRCGILIGEASLVGALSRLQTPWQLSTFTIEAAKAVLDYDQRTGLVQNRVQQLILERQRLWQQCQDHDSADFRIFSSHANFLLFQAHTPEAHTALLAAVARHRVLVSDLGSLPRLEHCVRVTIGQPAENDLFAQAFAQAVREIRPAASVTEVDHQSTSA
jgi:histidinol-phosphate aminotransferase